MRLLWIFLASLSSLFSSQGQSSYPYLSGYTWLFFADWRLTGPDGPRTEWEDFIPEQIKVGDVVFVDFGCFDLFTENYLPRIENPFILITSNYGYRNYYGFGDEPLPGRYGYLAYHPKISAWLVQNLDREISGNLVPIPIGLANRHWQHGNINIFTRALAEVQTMGGEKDIFMYVNLTYRPERADCIEHFKKLNVKSEKFKSFGFYLMDLARSDFVICPRGNGLDTHRLWEVLLLGSYPVVQTSTLDPLYEDLPVVVINKWEEVTPDFLRQKKEEFRKKTWNTSKLFAPYWFDKVRTIQAKLREEAQNS